MNIEVAPANEWMRPSSSAALSSRRAEVVPTHTMRPPFRRANSLRQRPSLLRPLPDLREKIQVNRRLQRLRLLIRNQRRVWWSQLLLSLTTRRLSPWRSFTQSVYQLEGLRYLASSKRVQQIRRGRTTPATLMTSAFSVTETVLTAALVSLIFWFEPGRADPNWTARLAELQLPIACAYALVVLFLEPFYVAAGFAMYLNRRAQLEAWDIEQELRRAFQA